MKIGRRFSFYFRFIYISISNRCVILNRISSIYLMVIIPNAQFRLASPLPFDYLLLKVVAGSDFVGFWFKLNKGSIL